MAKMNKRMFGALKSANQRMLQNRNRLGRVSGDSVSYDPGHRDDIVFVDRDVWNEIMQAFAETSTDDQTGGSNMDKYFDRLFKEIDDMKVDIKKISGIDKTVGILEERTKDIATKDYVMKTAGFGVLITVVTVLGGIFTISKFFT